MKTPSQILLAILVLFAVLQSVLAQQMPIPVILNGFSLIFDDRRAYFETASVGGFSLREGQKFNGIKLLSIDSKSGCALIDNRGEQQLLHICKTPDLILTPAGDSGQVQAAAPANANLRKKSAGGASGTPENALEDATGNPAQAEIVLTTGGGSGVAKSQDSNSSDSPPSNAASVSQTPNTKVYYWWVKEAQKIENARAQTAERVLAGEWPPYPRTPLTSPNANPQLVSEDSLYMEHGPGIIIAAQ